MTVPRPPAAPRPDADRGTDDPDAATGPIALPAAAGRPAEPGAPTPDRDERVVRTPRSEGRRVRPASGGARPHSRRARRPPDGAHEHGHGHGHGHAAPLPAGAARRARIVLTALLAPCLLAVLVGVVLLAPSPSEYGALIERTRDAAATNGAAAAAQQQRVDGEVREAGAVADCTDPSLPAEPGAGCVVLSVRLDSGPAQGRAITALVPTDPGTPQFAVGDAVVLAWSGDDPLDPASYQITDYQRGPPLALLGAVFALAVIALGRWQGLAALAALGVTLGVLALFVLPALLTGAAPVPVALVAAGQVVAIVFPLTHGASARTATAALGTLLSLALIGVLAMVFAAAGRLTGLGEETSELVGVLGPGIDTRGLLLAGVIIGALGVLDDMTVTQTSTVWELHRADPSRPLRDLYGSAMRVGRDHVASAVNTLVLAYAGAALPLLLLFALAGRGLGEVLTAEDVAQEVLRTLVGSIGVVASVPVTTVLAAGVVRSIRSRSVPA